MKKLLALLVAAGFVCVGLGCSGGTTSKKVESTKADGGGGGGGDPSSSKKGATHGDEKKPEISLKAKEAEVTIAKDKDDAEITVHLTLKEIAKATVKFETDKALLTVAPDSKEMDKGGDVVAKITVPATNKRMEDGTVDVKVTAEGGDKKAEPITIKVKVAKKGA